MRNRLDKANREIHFNWSLDDMHDFFALKGFRFQHEILTRYYLSLKTKPLVILTGISGTGKTKIAQIFAEYMCQHDSEVECQNRIAFIPVRPDWTDNRGLLGFYNLLDEKYHTTSLLDLLLNAEKQPDKPHFVILDEMNLAKVEYYFSDFLSLMESRTKDHPAGEAIRLLEKKNAETPDGQIIPGSIHIPANVFFTGTVNIDETTYMFSPKVLDRANVIEFNEVDIFDREVTTTGSEFRLKNTDAQNELENLSGFCSLDDFEQLQKLGSSPVGEMSELHEILESHNMHFGYRVANEMSRFCVLAMQEVDDFKPLDAMDIQILQKILPKFHGTHAKLDEPLNDLIEFCRRHAFVRSTRKIERMQKRLKRQGFTSFIDA